MFCVSGLTMAARPEQPLMRGLASSKRSGQGTAQSASAMTLSKYSSVPSTVLSGMSRRT